MHLLEVMTEGEKDQLDTYLKKGNGYQFSFNRKNYLFGLDRDNFILKYFLKTDGNCYLFPFPVVKSNLVDRK